MDPVLREELSDDCPIAAILSTPDQFKGRRSLASTPNDWKIRFLLKKKDFCFLLRGSKTATIRRGTGDDGPNWRTSPFSRRRWLIIPWRCGRRRDHWTKTLENHWRGHFVFLSSKKNNNDVWCSEVQDDLRFDRRVLLPPHSSPSSSSSLLVSCMKPPPLHPSIFSRAVEVYSQRLSPGVGVKLAPGGAACLLRWTAPKLQRRF